MFGMAWITKWTLQKIGPSSKHKTLHFSILVIQDHIESIGKPILLRRDEVLLNEPLASCA